MNDNEILEQTFLEEALELIDALEHVLVSISSKDQNLINCNDEIFRLVHSIKGSGRAVGFNQIADVAHQFENILTYISDSAGANQCENFLLPAYTVLDFFRESVCSLKKDKNSKIDTTNITHTLDTFQSRLYANSNAGDIKREGPTANGFGIFDSSLENSKESLKDQTTSNKPLPIFSSNSNETISIRLSKVDRFLEATGELNIIQSMLSELIKLEDVKTKKALGQLSKITKELQNSAMSMRLIPFSSLDNKLKRVVNESAACIGKNVRFTIDSNSSEVDKTILDNIKDPLVHLVRNAVDHGIESPEERSIRNKPETGEISLEVHQSSGRLFIKIKDDGKGILAENIRKRALKLGLISKNLDYSDSDLFQLIFMPGFSTAEQVTDISGRGVGMDVVKTNVEQLGGKIRIESIRGHGTQFEIEIPQTMSIIDSLVIRLDSQRFIVPITNVQESVAITPENTKTNDSIGERLLLRNMTIPLYDLCDVLKIERRSEFDSGIALITSNKKAMVAFKVDDIISRKQIVVKNLSQELTKQTAFSGTTILGDGKPAMIVDLNGLVNSRRSK